MPLFSIIVPVYNVEKYLHRCLASILVQSFSDYEVLLVDDGSPDSSGSICDVYSEKDSRIKVFHKENGGVSSARNVGLDNSKGEYILFVDADDELTSFALGAFAETIIRYKNADVIQGGVITIGGDKGFVVCPSLKEYDDSQDCVTNFLLHTVPWGIWSKAFRRDIIEKFHIRFVPGIIMGEDQLFMCHYQFHARSYAICAQDVYYYHLDNESSVMHNKDKTKSYCSEIRVAEESILSLPPNPNDLLFRFVYRFLSYENYDRMVGQCYDRNKVKKQIRQSYERVKHSSAPFWAKFMFWYLSLPTFIMSFRISQSLYNRLLNFMK